MGESQGETGARHETADADGASEQATPEPVTDQTGEAGTAGAESVSDTSEGTNESGDAGGSKCEGRGRRRRHRCGRRRRGGWNRGRRARHAAACAGRPDRQAEPCPARCQRCSRRRRHGGGEGAGAGEAGRLALLAGRVAILARPGLSHDRVQAGPFRICPLPGRFTSNRQAAASMRLRTRSRASRPRCSSIAARSQTRTKDSAFLHDMGRAVIEAFLHQDGGGRDAESASVLSALTSRP